MVATSVVFIPVAPTTANAKIAYIAIGIKVPSIIDFLILLLFLIKVSLTSGIEAVPR